MYKKVITALPPTCFSISNTQTFFLSFHGEVSFFFHCCGWFQFSTYLQKLHKNHFLDLCVCVFLINFVKWNNGCHEGEYEESPKGKLKWSMKIQYHAEMPVIADLGMGRKGWNGELCETLEIHKTDFKRQQGEQCDSV